FASAHYARKAWTSHELKSAQARALYEREEYILPVRFDDTEIPGLRPTVAYIDARTTSRDQVAELILQKLDERLTGAPLASGQTRTPPASVPPAPHISPSPKPAADQAVQRGAHRIERSPYLAGVSE